MRTATSLKLFAAAVIALLFAGFLMRAALRLANVAMHSFFVFGLLIIMAIWVFSGVRKGS
jgi:hypothetical protein